MPVGDVPIDDLGRIVDLRTVTGIQAVEWDVAQAFEGSQIRSEILDHHRGSAHDVIPREQNRPEAEAEVVVGMSRGVQDVESRLGKGHLRAVDEQLVGFKLGSWCVAQSRNVEIPRQRIRQRGMVGVGVGDDHRRHVPAGQRRQYRRLVRRIAWPGIDDYGLG